MSLNRRIILSVVVILALVAGSYAVEYIFKANGMKSATVIKVDYNNTPIALLNSEILSKLPGQKGENQAGPSLAAVLTSAGINSCRKVVVYGLNNDQAYTINFTDLNNKLIFYFTNHNTVNLGIEGNPHFLVEDVTEVNAE